MNKMKKFALIAVCAMLLVCVTIGATVAYLTSTESVENTFTVGNVEITLDEAKVDENGKAVEPEQRVKENTYHLLPGHTYTKDPTVHVEANSEDCYVKMIVTVSKAKELDEIFESHGGFDLTSIFSGYNEAWEDKGNTKDDEKNTRTYEFWYKDMVTKSENDADLPALFKAINVPGEIENYQLATIADMTITVKACAIQADGFTDAADAWDAFDA